MRRMYSKPQLLEAIQEESHENGIKLFEDIKDKDGHLRFIEGDVDISGTLPEGITKIYGKWSLSGSHLLIVLSLSFANGTIISSSNLSAELNIPDWIKERIVPLQGVYVDRKATPLYDSSLATQSLNTYLTKTSQNKMFITCGSLTLNADRNGRIAFDLLIDND